MRTTSWLLVVLALAATSTASAASNEAPVGYTRLLIPLTALDRPGVNGSRWVTEWWVFNSGNGGQTLDGPFPVIIASPTYIDNYVGGRQTRRFILVPADGGYDGAFVYVFSLFADSLTMSLRVRDTSVNAGSYGTQIPIVSDGAFKMTIRLIEVPTDPNYRVTLRAYGYTASRQTVHMSIYLPSGTQPIEERDLVLITGQPDDVVNGSYPYQRPAYIQLDPLSPLVRAAGPAVRIELENRADPSSRVWAFASITNNTTQEVTIVAP